MVSTRFMVIMGILLLLGLGILVEMTRKRVLSLRYALLWIILILGLALMIFIPGSLSFLANLLGIYDVMNMVFFLGFIFCLIVSFSLMISSARNSERIRKLTQDLGLKDHEIQELKKQVEEND